MDIGLEDTLPWGKYKGRKIADIVITDMPYLAWLRDKRAEGDKEKGYKSDIKFFSRSVLEMINKAIAEPTNAKWVLKGGHLIWNLEELFDGVVVPPTKEEIMATVKKTLEYPEWGMF